jgi:hypothetical protein
VEIIIAGDAWGIMFNYAAIGALFTEPCGTLVVQMGAVRLRPLEALPGLALFGPVAVEVIITGGAVDVVMGDAFTGARITACESAGVTKVGTNHRFPLAGAVVTAVSSSAALVIIAERGWRKVLYQACVLVFVTYTDRADGVSHGAIRRGTGLASSREATLGSVAKKSVTAGGTVGPLCCAAATVRFIAITSRARAGQVVTLHCEALTSAFGASVTDGTRETVVAGALVRCGFLHAGVLVFVTNSDVAAGAEIFTVWGWHGEASRLDTDLYSVTEEAVVAVVVGLFVD